MGTLPNLFVAAAAAIVFATPLRAEPARRTELLASYRVYRLDQAAGQVRVRALSDATESAWASEPEDSADESYPLGLRYASSLRVIPPGRMVAIHSLFTSRLIVAEPRSGSVHVLDNFGDFRSRSEVVTDSAGRYLAVIADWWYDTPHVFDLQLADSSSIPLRELIDANDVERIDWTAQPLATFTSDDVLLVASALDPWNPPTDSVWAIDLKQRRTLVRFEVPMRIQTLAYDAQRGLIEAINAEEIRRYDASSGELRSALPAPAPDANLRVVGDRYVAFTNTWIAVYERASGRLLNEMTLPRPFLSLRIPGDNGIAFAFFGEARRVTSVVAIDLDAMTTLGVFAVESPLTLIDIGAVEPSWTPPATHTPTSTPVDTATPTSTPTPSATPTMTPCGDHCPRVSVADVNARPGEVITIAIDIDASAVPLQAVEISLSTVEERGLDWWSRGEVGCAATDPTLVEVFERHLTCSVDRGTCGGVRPWVSRKLVGPDPWILPAAVRVLCRVRVSRDIPAGRYPIRLAAGAYDPDRHFVQTRLIPGAVIVAGGPATFTPTATRRATATPTSTRTATATATFGVGALAPTPCASGCPSLEISSATVVRSRVAAFEVRYHAEGQDAVAIQNDITVPHALLGDATRTSRWRCTGNPLLGRRALFREHRCGDGSCDTLRAIVLDTSARSTPVPDGALLYTCRLRISTTAPPGTYPLLVSRAVGSTATGGPIPLAATSATIAINAPTPD